MRTPLLVSLVLVGSSLLATAACSSKDDAPAGTNGSTSGGSTDDKADASTSADATVAEGGAADKAEACTCPGVPAGTETFRCESPDICGGKLPCVGANGKGACRVECCNDWTSCEANLGKQATCGANEICSCTNGIQCGNDGRCTCTGGVGTLGYCFPK